ncbi:thiopurine S-methyltransferase [Tetranychus urticae]|uniref:thiopurine S-methyltransferase n=1 Tax=Tetranychus urticae TaxID=32264 RepID=T1KXA7_TETUR|nr:thiopurine S-methyltransferase [Tetranychus urticae]
MSCELNNQNLEVIKDADNYTQMWKELWSARDTAWHLTHRNPTLVKYEDLLLNGRKSVRMLFPMCGKVIDMKYFWEQGHEVYGADCAPEAVQDFFNEQKLEYTSEKLDERAQIYSVPDKRLNIIQTNFLTLDNPKINKTIDCVWDRGAFGTITEDEQKLYIQTMKRLLAPDFRYLLLVTEFDDKIWTGVPFSQPEEKVREYFGDFCEIQKLESKIPDHVSLYQKHMQAPLKVLETSYLLKPKNRSQA